MVPDPDAAVALTSLAAAILPERVEAYLALMLVGFMVAIYGHLARLRWLVAIGIALVFLATLLFPIAINIVNDQPELPAGPRIYSP